MRFLACFGHLPIPLKVYSYAQRLQNESSGLRVVVLIWIKDIRAEPGFCGYPAEYVCEVRPTSTEYLSQPSSSVLRLFVLIYAIRRPVYKQFIVDRCIAFCTFGSFETIHLITSLFLIRFPLC